MHRSPSVIHAAALPLTVLALLAAGCSKDETTKPVPPTAVLVASDTLASPPGNGFG